MATLLATTAELQVFLTHLERGGSEVCLDYLPSFILLKLRCESRIEKILWTKNWTKHFQNLELISGLAYVDYVACMLAQLGLPNRHPGVVSYVH
jgi:hypothetical protein